MGLYLHLAECRNWVILVQGISSRLANRVIQKLSITYTESISKIAIQLQGTTLTERVAPKNLKRVVPWDYYLLRSHHSSRPDVNPELSNPYDLLTVGQTALRIDASSLATISPTSTNQTAEKSPWVFIDALFCIKIANLQSLYIQDWRAPSQHLSSVSQGIHKEIGATNRR